MRLDDGEAERIAALVAAELRREPPPRYLDAAGAARTLGVGRDWVYEHAEELGAIRLGGGQGRLRFDQNRLHERLVAGGPVELAGRREPDTHKRSRPKGGTAPRPDDTVGMPDATRRTYPP